MVAKRSHQLLETLRRTGRQVLLFSPLIFFALVSLTAQFPERVSLLLHGHLFAQVIPKGSDIFRYVPADSLRCTAIVFSGSKAIGWIEQPTFDFPRFVAFSKTPSLGDPGFDIWFDILAPIGWLARWWVVLVQAIVIVFWISVRYQKRPGGNLCTVCGYDLRATPDRCPECGNIPGNPLGAHA